MNKIDHNAPLSKSTDIVSENIQQLQQLFPEVFKEGKIDWQELQATLGEHIDAENERFNFTWNGKSNARKEAQKPSTGTLRPAPEESVDWDTTQNLYIEGDNLEVLKLLQKSYHQKVKMIYIDPPYNTGKDFVYKDNYKDNLSNYLELTGQKDEEGKKLSTNSDASGRYHSNWLNMMYPRLKLARNLLKDDGVIFISIDDNEINNLKNICNEIFGEDNVEVYIWDVREDGTMPKTAKKTVRKEHEYLVAAFKTTLAKRLDKYESFKYKDNNWGNPDNDPRGPWMSANISRGSGIGSGGSKSYIIKNPTGVEFDRDWSIGEDEFKDLLEDNRIYFADEGRGVPRKKIFQNEPVFSIQSSIFEKLKSSQSASKNLENLLGKIEFDYPKPVNLIERLIQIGSSKDDIIIDFFSGTGSAANAVMNINNKHESDRKFIMVQLPEPTEKDSKALEEGYKTIADIGKERIRRAGKKLKEEHPDKAKDLDLGFKVFKLDSSNIKAWSPEAENLEQNLLDAVENIKEGRTENDLLFEILLKYGLDLTLPITEHDVAGAKVFNVGAGALLVCLADDITVTVAEGVAELKNKLNPEICRVVFKDNGFKDSAVKTNVMQKLKQHNIEEVRSI